MTATPPVRPRRRLIWPGLAGLAAGWALLLSACALGPNFTRPPPPAAAGYGEAGQAGLAAHSLRLGQELPRQWWTLYRSPPLSRLIDQALAGNPDLHSAHARLLAAREMAIAKHSAFLPVLGLSASAARQQVAGAQFGNPDFGGTQFDLFNTSVNVSYTFDVWGSVRRQVENLAAQAEYQRFELEATFLALTANIVTTAIHEAAARAELEATRAMAQAQAQRQEVLERQLALGGASQKAVLAEQAALAQTQAALPPLELRLGQLRNRLKALVGSSPEQALAAEFRLEELHMPEQLPLSLPSKLVAQRPDIRAQEALLHAASAQIGVVMAGGFPDFTIQANVGTIATQMGGLFIPGSEIWSLSSNLMQPVFRGGEFSHRRQAARAAYQEAAERYRGVVLTGLRHVADTLVALKSGQDALATQIKAERTAQAALALIKAQFHIGAASHLELLTAERDHQQARLGQIQAKAAQLADSAALFQALGGGWWQREDLPKTLGDARPRPQRPRSLRGRLRQFTEGN